MMFLTVGSQMPFDRLVKSVDAWAMRNPSATLFAQIGKSDYRPQAMEWVHLLGPEKYRERFLEADLIISHAGMGTVITAADYGKRLIVMPRREGLGETRNDHQIATAKWLPDHFGICVAMDDADMMRALDDWPGIVPCESTNADAKSDLVMVLSKFINS